MIQKAAAVRQEIPAAERVPAAVSETRFYHVINGPGTYSVPEIHRTLTVSEIDASAVGDFRHAQGDTAFFDAAVLTFPLTLRNWLAGDRFFPLGAPGRQKVKQFFIDHKVPKQERSVCPLLVARGRIAWIGGYRIAQWARVTESTRKVLRVQLSLALH
jgi:tRNA(Ile)-lysidine synthase